MSDPLEPVRVLVQRLRDEAEKLGLQLEHEALIPGKDGGPDFLQAVFTMKPESLAEPEPEKSETDMEFDRMFEEIAREERRAEEKSKVDSMKDDVEKWLKGG